MVANEATRPAVIIEDGIWAGAVAGIVSGVPSTLWAIALGGDPLEASKAAGTLLLPRERRLPPLLLSAALAHVALSLAWGVVLAAVLPRRRPLASGVLAGLGIAALDLGLGRRHRSSIANLPVGPQIADHVAFGVTVGALLARRAARPGPRRGRARRPSRSPVSPGPCDRISRTN